MHDEITRKKIGTRLQQVRKYLKLKQKEMARRTGVSGPTYSELEAGKHYPGCEFLIKICREFNVNIEYLLIGKGKVFIEMNEREKQWKGIEELAWGNEEVRLFLDYFEHSSIMRYYLLSQFKIKLMTDDPYVAKEMQEFLKSSEEKVSDNRDMKKNEDQSIGQ